MASFVFQVIFFAAVVMLSYGFGSPLGSNFVINFSPFYEADLETLYTSHSKLPTESEILDSILDKAVYDSRIRPSGVNKTGPVLVKINMYIRHIEEIDDNKMEFSVQITFRQSWQDGRLAYNNQRKLKYLTLTDAERIWKPDVFFSNEKSGNFHNIVVPNILLRIFPNGDVLYSTRLSLKLFSPMDLHNFPMDRQVCSIILASYGYTTDDLVFTWKADGPIQMSKNLQLPQFTLNSVTTDSCTSKTITGEYSCLKTDLIVSREFNYYFIQMYLPSILPVVLSWASFWINQKATTARFAVWITTFLTLVMKVAAFNQKLPVVAYNKAIDIWSGLCFTFLYAALIELAVVAYVVFSERKKRKGHGDDDCPEDSKLKKLILDCESDGTAKSTTESNPPQSILSKLLQKYPSRGQRIDMAARFLFPFMFVFFNIIYWSTYYRSEESF